MNYYPFHIGDYRSDTSHLSLVEHGIYRQLIDWYYLDEHCIPAETNLVFRRLQARTDDEKAAVKTILDEFFRLTPEGYSHSRCDAEIAKYQSKAEVARSNGKSGGRPKKTDPVISGLPQESGSKANQEPLTTNQEPEKKGGERITDACPHSAILDLFHERLPTARQVRAWTPARQQALRSRWREDKARQSLEWWSEFFDYIARSDFLCGRSVARQGGKPFEVSMDWICKQENFVKILEGTYEN